MEFAYTVIVFVSNMVDGDNNPDSWSMGMFDINMLSHQANLLEQRRPKKTEYPLSFNYRLMYPTLIIQFRKGV